MFFLSAPEALWKYCHLPLFRPSPFIQSMTSLSAPDTLFLEMESPSEITSAYAPPEQLIHMRQNKLLFLQNKRLPGKTEKRYHNL